MNHRLIIVGDTHCRFDVLEAIIAREQERGPGVAAVLHVGDIGLYDSQSMARLSSRERHLIEKHKNPIHLSHDYLEGRATLPVPMSAIPGNHEDFELVERMERRQLVLEGLHLLVPGERVTVTLGHTDLDIMGLGRHRPDHLSTRSLRKRKFISDESLEATIAAGSRGQRPDILLLHDPPCLRDVQRGRSFGGSALTRVVSAITPRLTVAGHMHFEYTASVSGSPVHGVGYGIYGRYALLNEDFTFTFEDLEGRPPAAREAEQVMPAANSPEAADAEKQRRRDLARRARLRLPVTAREVATHFHLELHRKALRTEMKVLMKQLRERMLEDGELSREAALELAGRFFIEHGLLAKA